MDKDKPSKDSSGGSPYLVGKLLLAMPAMNDPRFHRSVILICAHDEKGAMGLVINHPLPEVQFGDLLQQLDIASEIKVDLKALNPPVMRGGPVDGGRGFLLHGSDYEREETVAVNEDFAITGTLEAIEALASGEGPKEFLFILGYAGWSAGQLDSELQNNSWLVADPDHALIFGAKTDDIWTKAVSSLGFDPMMLSGEAGSA